MSENLSEEIQHLAERYRNAPDSRIFAPLADAYRKSGLLDKAIELCEKGIEKYPEYASARVILGKCYYDKGATERSRTEFEKVVQLDPENMVALKFMGDILLAEGDRDTAVEYYKRLLAIDPTNVEVDRILEELETEFEVKEIDLEDEDSVKKVERPRELATLTLAGIYAAQGYHSKAMKMYRDILDREPGNAEAGQMLKKLESIVESSEKERGESFDDEVMTISVDDVDRGFVEATSGPGGRGEVEEEVPEIGEGGEDEEALEDGEVWEGGEESEIAEGEDDIELEEQEAGADLSTDEIESAAQQLEEEDEISESVAEEDASAGEQGDEDGRENIRSFKDWLKQMHEKQGRDD